MTTQTQRKFGRSAKLQHLCAQIHHKAVALGPDAKLPTVVQLSEELNVSKATINSALRELEEQNIVSRKHGVGLFVSGEVNRKTVALICDSNFFHPAGQSPFWDILLEKSRRRASVEDELLEIHFAQLNGSITGPIQRGIAREIKEGHVHGAVGVGLDIGAATWIEDQKVPFVAVFGPGKHSISFNGFHEVDLGVEALLTRGCRRLGLFVSVAPRREFVLPHPNNDVAVHFRKTLIDHGLAVHEPSLQLNRDLVSGHQNETLLTDIEQGIRSARKVFGAPRSEWPDGIMIVNDLMTQGALIALQQLGVRPGIDVHIACHSNKGARVLHGFQVPLARVEFDPDELVDAVFSKLEDLMRGRNAPESSQVILPKLRWTDD